MPSPRLRMFVGRDPQSRDGGSGENLQPLHFRRPPALRNTRRSGERELGLLLVQQRTSHASGAMGPFRAKALDQLLPGWLQTTDEAWADRARELSSFVPEHGRMPQAGPKNWVHCGSARNGHTRIWGPSAATGTRGYITLANPWSRFKRPHGALISAEPPPTRGSRSSLMREPFKFVGRGKRGQASSASANTAKTC